MHEVLVNRLEGLSLPRKSVVRLTDRPDMTLDFYRGRKTTIQQHQPLSILSMPCQCCFRVSTVHTCLGRPSRKRRRTFYGPELDKIAKIFFLFLKSAKINLHENVHKDKNAKINSRELSCFTVCSIFVQSFANVSDLGLNLLSGCDVLTHIFKGT